MAKRSQDDKTPPDDTKPLGLKMPPEQMSSTPPIPTAEVSRGDAEATETKPAAKNLKTFPSKKPGETVSEADPDERIRLGKEYRCCPYHKTICVPTGSPAPFFTWYACPVLGCTYSEKVPRPRLGEYLQRQAEQTNFSAR